MKQDRSPAHRQSKFIKLGIVFLLGALAAAGCFTPSPSTRETDATSDIEATPSVSPTADSSPTPTPPIASETPEFDVGEWLAERTQSGEKHAVLIASMEPSRTIARADQETTINPASLIKLATSLVALKRLGADYRFDTRVFADGVLTRNGAFKGDLYFSGSDPVFTDVSASAVAKALEERGIKRIDGKIVVNPEFSFNFSALPEESAKLLARGLNLEKTPAIRVSDEAAGSQIFTFRSQPLHRILLYQNTFSSNFVAHRLGDEIGGVEQIRQYLIEELKLPADGVKLETASGLKSNGMSAIGIFAVIRELNKELKRQGRVPVDILPIAAEQTSTLSRRLSGSEFERATVGKTGTLSARDGGPGIASLAGIAYTQKSGPIVFVLISEGREITKHKFMHDELLKLLLDSNADPQIFDLKLPRDLLQSSETSIVPGSDLKRESK